MTNDEVMARAGANAAVSASIRCRQAEFFAHCWRREDAHPLWRLVFQPGHDNLHLMVLPGRRLPGQQIRRMVPWARQALGTAETMLKRVKARGFLPANYRIEALLEHKVDLAYEIHQYEKWELRDRDARIRESRLWSQDPVG